MGGGKRGGGTLDVGTIVLRDNRGGGGRRRSGRGRGSGGRGGFQLKTCLGGGEDGYHLQCHANHLLGMGGYELKEDDKRTVHHCVLAWSEPSVTISRRAGKSFPA